MVHLEFFDGASHDVGANCGAGALLWINDSCCYKLKMGCGKGSNTRGAPLALWSLFYFVYTKHNTFMHVYRDSNIIIDWVNGSGRLQVSMLHNWKMKMKDLIPFSSHLEFHHIYREFVLKQITYQNNLFFLMKAGYIT